MSLTRENLKWSGIGIVGFVVLVLIVIFLTSCGDVPPDEAEAAPSPERVAMTLDGQAADSFVAVATWGPVVHEGDTIRRYRRTITRTDTAQNLDVYIDDNASLRAIGSETFALPSPGEGEVGSYRYCLRSVRADGVAGQDSTCASFQYTAPVAFPPPPDSLDVSPEQTVTVDSLIVKPDSIHFVSLTDAGHDSTTEVRQYYEQSDGSYRTVFDTVPEARFQLTARLYSGKKVIGCAGDCSAVMVEPATWENGVPVHLTGRPGYEIGREWMAQRLPWFRQLSG